MNIDLNKLSKAFKEDISSNSSYQEVLYLVKTNTSGKLWLFGGAVYKTLTNKLYNAKADFKDFDFFAEKVNENIRPLSNWKIVYGRFSNPKFRQINGRLELDIVPLTNIDHLKENSLSPTIENFLKVTPLNIFSIVYDLESEKLIGEIGKQALEERVVKINNIKSAMEMAKKYKTDIKNIIDKRAKELNFKAEYPY